MRNILSLHEFTIEKWQHYYCNAYRVLYKNVNNFVQILELYLMKHVYRLYSLCHSVEVPEVNTM